MTPHNLSSALEGLGELEFNQLASFNKGTVGTFRASAGVSPWERHPDDDEFLHVLAGEGEIGVITPEGWRKASVTAGSVFIVPRGLWHRHTIREKVVELFVTPGETEHSTATDPTLGDDQASLARTRRPVFSALLLTPLGPTPYGGHPPVQLG